MKTKIKKIGTVILIIGFLCSSSQTQAQEQFEIQNYKSVKSFKYDGFNDREKMGSYAVEGLFIGLASGFVLGGLWGMAAFDHSEGFWVGAPFGAGVCGLVGLGIGAIMPRYNNIQITPIFNPTKTSGTDMGVNVGVKF